MFVSGSQDKSVRFWDLRTGGCVNVISPPVGNATKVKLFPKQLIEGGSCFRPALLELCVVQKDQWSAFVISSLEGVYVLIFVIAFIISSNDCSDTTKHPCSNPGSQIFVPELYSMNIII